MSNINFNSDFELSTTTDETPCIYDVINDEYDTSEYSVYHGFSPAEISCENIMDVPLSPIRVDWPETCEEITEVNTMMSETTQNGPCKKRFRKVGKVPRSAAAKKAKKTYSFMKETQVKYATTARKEPRHLIAKQEIEVKKEVDGVFYVGKKTKININEAVKLKLKRARYHNDDLVKDAGEFSLFIGNDKWFYARRSDDETYRIPYHKGQASYVFSWRGGVERASRIKGWEKPKMNY